jgi:hypothetical protein
MLEDDYKTFDKKDERTGRKRRKDHSNMRGSVSCDNSERRGSKSSLVNDSQLGIFDSLINARKLKL